MQMFSVQSLWPGRDRAPVWRVGLALLMAPASIAGLFSGLVFMIAGMTETSADGVLRVTVEAAAALSALVYLFTLTFGLAGIALLWRLGRRGVLAWAAVGGAAGAVAGAVFNLALPDPDASVVLACAFGGWALFLLIRSIAGVSDIHAAA